MSQINLVIYGLAAICATQSLFQLMVQHRRVFLRRLQMDELQRRAAQAPASEPATGVALQPEPAKGSSANTAVAR